MKPGSANLAVRRFLCKMAAPPTIPWPHPLADLIILAREDGIHPAYRPQPAATMQSILRLFAVFALIALGACGSSPTPLTKDPAVERDFAKRREDAAKQEAERQEFRAVLLRLDTALSNYSGEIAERGNPRADKRATSMRSFLRKTVDKHFEPLLAVANGAGSPGDRAVALASLGFASGDDALSALAAGAACPDPFVANAAVFGMAEKRDPKRRRES